MKIELDKLVHFFASGWLFFVLLTLIGSLPIAVFGAFSVGIAKEFYDYKKTGFNILDLVWNFGGIALSVLIYLSKNHAAI